MLVSSIRWRFFAPAVDKADFRVVAVCVSEDIQTMHEINKHIEHTHHIKFTMLIDTTCNIAAAAAAVNHSFALLPFGVVAAVAVSC